jgi:hypothetical protein
MGLFGFMKKDFCSSMIVEAIKAKIWTIKALEAL